VAAASLTLTKADDPDPVEVGKTLTYTLTYEYRGDGPAHNAVICDELDPGVELLSAEPSPSRIDDAKLIWTVPLLENNSIERITIAGHVSESAPDGALLQNSFNISCDELGALPAKSIFTTVHNGSRLAVSKTALQKAVRRGEVADFVITVCNRGGQAATNITVRDVFDSTVEVVSVWPEPSGDGLWRFGSLEPGACLQMGLSARVPRTDVAYESHQNISGRASSAPIATIPHPVLQGFSATGFMSPQTGRHSPPRRASASWQSRAPAFTFASTAAEATAAWRAWSISPPTSQSAWRGRSMPNTSQPPSPCRAEGR